ncbi:MAG TPA: ABC transporter permease [Gemmatimonadales bacterium]|jgi:predicted permease|nr:ABC transporter permease [Gemmatimonadales bacterium]
MTPSRRLFRLSGKEPGPGEDVAAEFEAHLQHKTEALIRSGMAPDEARREAERRFGTLSRYAAECRVIDTAERKERRRREWWEGAVQDLRQAGRALLRAPGFTITAVLVLTLGIGLNATVFSVLRGVVLKPLPYPESDRLIKLYASNPKDGWPLFSVSPADFYDWSRESKSFHSMVAWTASQVAATGMGPAEQLPVVSVTSGFQAVTGVAPMMGRGFAIPEFEAGAPLVTILSYETWARQFGREAGVLGKRWILDGESYEIIGVMPKGFEFPIGQTSAWLPFHTPKDVATQRGAHYLDVAGRLAGGATVAGAKSELVTLAARIEKEFPKSSANWTVDLRPLHEDVVEDARPTLILLMTGVALLLILACANVANLVLVRAIGRSGEVALRSALGAGRGRLLWHGASEVLVLVGIGALGAIPVAVFGASMIRRFAPEGVPRIESVRLDAPSLLFTLGVTALAALLVSLAPAHRIGRVDLRTALSGGNRSVGTRRGLHRWLVTLETAVALALLAVAGVLVKSKLRLEQVNPGFDPSSTLTASVSLPDKTYGKSEAIVQFQNELLRRLRAINGVQSAALAFGLPLTGFGYSSSFTIDSVPVPDGVSQSAQLRLASTDYFTTQRIPVVAGRGFTAEDRRGGRPAVVISQAAAKKFWPDGRFLGRFVRVSAQPGPDDDRPQGYVVGVVGDVRERGLDKEPRAIIYGNTEMVPESYLTIVLRTTVKPLSLVAEVRKVVAAMDPDIPVSEVQTMEDVVRHASASQRFRAWVMGFFALLAAALAGLGVYGVISHIVAQRTREMGLRRALGASDSQVVGEVVRSGMRDAALGTAGGLAAGWLIARSLAKLLYQVAPADPVVMGLSAALFLGVAFTACWIPARRATRADPVIVLRGE